MVDSTSSAQFQLVNPADDYHSQAADPTEQGQTSEKKVRIEQKLPQAQTGESAPEARSRAPVAQMTQPRSAGLLLNDAVAFGEGMVKRDVRKNGLIKDGLSYLCSMGSIAASNGFAALAQPLFRVALNMAQHAIDGFRSGQGSSLKRLGAALDGAIASLRHDFSATAKGIKKFFNKPTQELKTLLLSGSQAPKTWGHLGALLGGLIGGITGGPLMAGVGFLAGRYAGQAIGRFLSYATGNSGLTLGETARQALFAGFASLTDNEKKEKLKTLEAKRNELIEGVISHLKQATPLPQNFEALKKEIVLLSEALQHNIDTTDSVKIYKSSDENEKNDGAEISIPWSAYFATVENDMVAIGQLVSAKNSASQAAGPQKDPSGTGHDAVNDDEDVVVDTDEVEVGEGVVKVAGNDEATTPGQTQKKRRAKYVKQAEWDSQPIEKPQPRSSKSAKA
jgi:hypothetical protein